MRPALKIVACFSLFVWGLPMPAQGNVEKETVLTHLRKALHHWDSLDLKASSSHTTASDGGEAIGTTAKLSVKRLGTRVFLSRKSMVERPGQEPSILQNDYLVYENGEVLQSQAALDSSLHQLAGVNPTLGFQLSSMSIAGMQKWDLSSAYDGWNDDAACLWVIGYAPLLEYIEKADAIDVEPAGQGARVHALSKQGEFTAELSESSGWLPTSFKIEKGQGHLFRKNRLGETGTGSIKSIVWTGQASDFVVHPDGSSTPGKMTMLRRAIFGAAPVTEVKTNIIIENVVCNPPLTDADFQTTIMAPVGHPVSVAGAKHLYYMWDGTRAVASVQPLAKVASGQVPNSGSTLRTGLFLLNVAVIAIIAVVLWRRHYAK